MQERRILTYIDKEDIPSSAVAITANNFTSVQGNVFYIPFYTKIWSNDYADSQPQINIAPASGTSGTILSVNGHRLYDPNWQGSMKFDSSAHFILPYNKSQCNNTYFLNLIFYPGVSYSSIDMLRVANGNVVAMIPGDGDTKPYSVVKFGTQARILSITDMNEFFYYYDPIYIDNE